jgi:hypothetical protein
VEKQASTHGAPLRLFLVLGTLVVAEMNTERFSDSIGAIKGLVAKLASMHDIDLKVGESPTSPLKEAEVAAKPNNNESVATPLKTEGEVLAAIEERVACQCEAGLWQQVQDSMKSQHQRDERRVWRQIVAAIRVNDEAEASRLAKAAGIPMEFLKS